MINQIRDIEYSFMLRILNYAIFSNQVPGAIIKSIIEELK